jgi:hypothetical protein
MVQRMLAWLAYAVFGSTTLALTSAMSFAAQPPAESLLAAVFSDHAVLQRDRPIDVWGRANAGEEVIVTLSGTTRVRRCGRRETRAFLLGGQSVVQSVRCRGPAGGPFEIEVQS